MWHNTTVFIRNKHMLDKNAALMKCKEILQCQCCKETLKCRQFLEDYLHSMRSS